MIWMKLDEGSENLWKLLTKIKLEFVMKNMQKVSKMDCYIYNPQKTGFIKDEDITNNVKSIEDGLNVMATDITFENITDEALEMAGEMFIYLNQCPGYLYGWQLFYSDLLNGSPPDVIILTLNRILKSAKNSEDVIANLAKMILGRITDLLQLKYEGILDLSLKSRQPGLDMIEPPYGKHV